MKRLEEITRIVFEQCFALSGSETVLVVTDGYEPELAGSFYRSASTLAAEALMLQFTPRSRHGEEPPEAVARAMREVDVAVLTTSFSLSHTRARREACAAGARIASMPMVGSEMALRTLDLDYEALEKTTQAYVQLLSAGRSARLTSPAGTDITFNLQGREALLDAGKLQERGASGNLPAGEAYIAPVEGDASGALVFDGSLAGWGKLADPVTITVENGLAKEISGGEAAQWLEDALDRCGAAAGNIAELGIGTNRRAGLSGFIIEDEKAIGTVHVAVGDNKGIGGTVEVPLHLDGLVLSPTLVVDGRKVIEGGRLLL